MSCDKWRLLKLIPLANVPLFFGWMAWIDLQQGYRAAAICQIATVACLLAIFTLALRTDNRLVWANLKHLNRDERRQFDASNSKRQLRLIVLFVIMILGASVIGSVWGTPWLGVAVSAMVVVTMLLVWRESRPLEQFLQSTDHARTHGGDSPQQTAGV
jgi:hypothetical protein